MIIARAFLLLAAATATGAAVPTQRVFVSADRTVRLTYPADLTPSRDFPSHSLLNSGWRVMWTGDPAGSGQPVTSFQILARTVDGIGQVTEWVQIGSSRAPSVVATCGTAGLSGAARRMPNRMLGGHRWTVWTSGDAGMSQEAVGTSLRTVVNGACYAVDRIGYVVKAGDPPPRTAPTQAAAARRMDQIMNGIRVGA